jgi:hypothetical protein
MPFTFSIDSSERRVYTTVSGPVLDADPIRYLSELLDHPDYRPGFSALVVCRNIRLGAFSSGAVRRLAEFTRETEAEFRGSRVAVAADQLAAYGLARMYHLLRDPPYELQVFRERSGAEAWLSDPSPRSRHR